MIRLRTPGVTVVAIALFVGQSSMIAEAQPKVIAKQAMLPLRCDVVPSMDKLAYEISIWNDTQVPIQQGASIHYRQGRTKALVEAQYVLLNGLIPNDRLFSRALLGDWTEGECYAWVGFVRQEALSTWVAQ